MKKALLFNALLGITLAISSHLYSAGVFAYVTNAQDNSVSVIDTATDIVVSTIGVGFFPTDIAASQDGTFVFVPMFTEDTIYAIDTATNTTQNVITTPADAKPTGIAVAPNGFVYCVNFSNSTVFVINPASMTEVANFPVGAIFPVDVAIAPDGAKAYVVNAVGPQNVRVIDLNNNTIIATVTTSQQSMGVAITPDGSRVYVTNPLFDSITVIDTSTETAIANISLATGSNPRGIAITPNGLHAYVILQGNSNVDVIEIATNTVTTTIPLTSDSDPYHIAITPDGTKAYVTETLTGNVRVIDTTTNTVTGTITVGAFPFSVAIADVP